jgi:hypothetical protein
MQRLRQCHTSSYSFYLTTSVRNDFIVANDCDNPTYNMTDLLLGELLCISWRSNLTITQCRLAVVRFTRRVRHGRLARSKISAANSIE